jgi:hypothetical protein
MPTFPLLAFQILPPVVPDQSKEEAAGEVYKRPVLSAITTTFPVAPSPVIVAELDLKEVLTSSLVPGLVLPMPTLPETIRVGSINIPPALFHLIIFETLLLTNFISDKVVAPP